MVKIIKKKIASKTSENDEIEYQEDLLIRQENNWKTYSTVYDEIREDCRLDYLQDLGNVHSHTKSALDTPLLNLIG